MRKASGLPPPGSGTDAPRADCEGGREGSEGPKPAAAEPPGRSVSAAAVGSPAPAHAAARCRRAEDARCPPRLLFIFSGGGVCVLWCF